MGDVLERPLRDHRRDRRRLWTLRVTFPACLPPGRYDDPCSGRRGHRRALRRQLRRRPQRWPCADAAHDDQDRRDCRAGRCRVPAGRSSRATRAAPDSGRRSDTVRARDGGRSFRLRRLAHGDVYSVGDDHAGANNSGRAGRGSRDCDCGVRADEPRLSEGPAAGRSARIDAHRRRRGRRHLRTGWRAPARRARRRFNCWFADRDHPDRTTDVLRNGEGRSGAACARSCASAVPDTGCRDRRTGCRRMCTRRHRCLPAAVHACRLHRMALFRAHGGGTLYPAARPGLPAAVPDLGLSGRSRRFHRCLAGHRCAPALHRPSRSPHRSRPRRARRAGVYLVHANRRFS